MATIPLEELQKFDIFRDLTETEDLGILKRTKLFHVFPRDTAVIVTTDHEVYGVGRMVNWPKRLTKIDFGDVKIKDFIPGYPFCSSPGNGNNDAHDCFALAEDGSIWEKVTDTADVTKMEGLLEGKEVIQLVATVSHAMALTKDGQVHVWGRTSDSDVDENDAIPPPKTIPQNKFGNHKVTEVAISCGISAALVETGELFVWGCLVGSYLTEPKLCGVSTFFKKVIGTQLCLYGVTIGGRMYEFNAQGKTVTSTLCIYRNVVDIASDPYCSNVAVKFYDAVLCFSSGNRMKGNEKSTTRYHSMDDAFLGQHQMTYRTIRAPFRFQIDSDGGSTNSIQVNLANLWHRGGNECEVSEDITFLVDGRQILAHKTILMLRSAYFRKMFNGNWQESKEKHITVSETTYPIFKALLAYIYTDKIVFPLEDYKETFELMQLADLFLDKGLRSKCEEQLMKSLNLESVFFCLKNAASVHAHDLEQCALNFCIDNNKEISNRWTFGELNEFLGDDIMGMLFSLIGNYSYCKCGDKVDNKRPRLQSSDDSDYI